MGFLSKVKAFLFKPFGFAAAASLVTALLLGGVGLAVSPVGCLAAQRLGIATNGGKCAPQPVALVTPSPSPASSPSLELTPPLVSAPIPTPSPRPSPTRNPNYPPYQYDASGSYPPMYESSSRSWPSEVNFTCRLPVVAQGPGSGGFIAFPSRQWIADPRSAVTLPPPPAGYTPPPYYGGPQFTGLSYDRSLGRWLPVPRNWVAPDGKRYAYNYANDDGVYVVTVATGAQVELGEGTKWEIRDFAAEGVYVVPSNGGAGLWLLPFTGAAKQLTSTGYWQTVGGGAAYGTATSAVPQGAANTILRFDLKTLKSQPWFTAANSQSSVIGFDAKGAPVIFVSFNIPNSYPGYGQQIWIVPALAQGYVIINRPTFGGQGLVADSHGIWFSDGNQQYLFIPGKGTYVAARIGGQVAGACA